MKKRKSPRIVKIAIRMAIVFSVVSVLSSFYFSACELKINAETRKLQSEISEVQADIDGLDIKKSELASFSRLKKVASSKGYSYKQGSTAAVVESDEEE